VRRITFHDQGWDDYQWWATHDPRALKRINALIKECQRTPEVGLGKPEHLKYVFQSPWSRRITQEHRLVYSFDDDHVEIWQCRFHY
jgi:toxin YoeB